MALVYPTVPLDTNAIPSNINSIIAQGPQNVPNLGTASQGFINNYYAGQQNAYQQRNQNAFPNGLPTNPDGSINYGAAYDTLVKAGGAGTAAQVLPQVQSLGVQQQIMNQPLPSQAIPQASSPPSSANAIPSQNVAGPPNTAGGSQTTDQSLTPQQVASANPNGTPQAVSTPQTTPRALSQQTGVSVGAIANAAGVGPDDPIPPQARGAVINVLRSSPPGSATGAPQPSVPPSSSGPQAQQVVAQAQPQPVQNAQAQIPPPSADEQRARMLSEYFGRQAEALGVNKNTSAAAKAATAQSENYARIADQLQQARIQGAQFTPEQKNLSSGASGLNEAQKLQVDQGQKTYAGIQAQSTQYERDLQPYLSVARAILNDPRVYTGIGGQASLDINRVRALFGNQNAAVLQEALTKVTAASVLSQINTQRDQLQEAGGTSSRIFSSQIEQVEKASASLANTVSGNRFLVNVQTRMGDLASKVAQMARDYRSSHPLGLDSGFDQQVADYMKANPVFTKQEQDHPDWLAAPDTPSAASKWAPSQAVQWGASLGLRPGDVVRMNGRYVKIPQLQGAPNG